MSKNNKYTSLRAFHVPGTVHTLHMLVLSKTSGTEIRSLFLHSEPCSGSFPLKTDTSGLAVAAKVHPSAFPSTRSVLICVFCPFPSYMPLDTLTSFLQCRAAGVPPPQGLCTSYIILLGCSSLAH